MPSKYKEGDCLSIEVEPTTYLGFIITKKYKKYYDCTLIDYFQEKKPSMIDFEEGNCFGTRFGPIPEITYAVNVRMIACKYIDEQTNIEKIGSINISPKTDIDGYAYLATTEELYQHYKDEINIRIQKTKNAEKFPNLGYVGKHLIAVKKIMEG